MFKKLRKKSKKPPVKRKLHRANIFQDGPHVVAALLCERVIEEKDGTKSAVRIVDRITQTQTTTGETIADQMQPLTINLSLLIRLKAGKNPDKARDNLKIAMVDPTGKEANSVSRTISLEGGPNRGADVVLNMNLGIRREGLHWFEIWWGDFLLTRTPFEVIYVIQKQSGPAPAPGPVQ